MDFTLSGQLEMIYKVASGLEFLHTPGVFHPDFKDTNIIMDGDNPQIIDFGFSVIIDSPTEVVTALYRPPELTLKGGNVSYYTDIPHNVKLTI